VNLVLTGRDMSQDVVEAAHTVTDLVKIKHAFDAGYVAKRGIDY
jgi:cob(I)alamin adenosyltransferase